MLEQNNHDVSVLNSLITTTIDSANGFEEAAKDASNPQFQTMLRDFAADRRQCVTMMQEAVRTMGGEPADDGSLKAAAHRGWLNLKEAISGGSDKKVIEEVENGEDYIKGKFEAAMKDDQLSPAARSVITEAYGSVRAGHDRASALKHQMEGAA